MFLTILVKPNYHIFIAQSVAYKFNFLSTGGDEIQPKLATYRIVSAYTYVYVKILYNAPKIPGRETDM